MKHTRVTDEMLADIQAAAPWARRQEIGPPPATPESEIGIASTVVEDRPGEAPVVWAPFQLDDEDLELLAESKTIWFARHGLPIRPFSGAVAPWGLRHA